MAVALIAADLSNVENPKAKRWHLQNTDLKFYGYFKQLHVHVLLHVHVYIYIIYVLMTEAWLLWKKMGTKNQIGSNKKQQKGIIFGISKNICG